MKPVFGLALASALAMSVATAAAAKPGREEMKRYCTGDATVFCPGVDPGKPMAACFRKHRRELSRNCRRAIDAYQAGGGR